MSSAAPADDQRPVILLFYRYFSPSYDATGPTQSLRRMAAALGGQFRFRVVTLAFDGEPQCRWGEAFGIERIAVAPGLRGLVQLWKLVRTIPHDLAIHNSFFDPLMTIAVLLMRKLRLIPRRPTLVAPRGEFSPGALAIKPVRKRSYLGFVRMLGLENDVHLQATDPVERKIMEQVLPSARSILEAPNIRSLEPLPPHSSRAPGEPLRVAFLSRIDRMKNLDFALKLLAASGAQIRYDVIGPRFNPAYWAECRKLIAAMPPNVTVKPLGPVPADQVVSTLARYDLMLLPTAGENYGHAIVDSLVAGTPVLISDRTPWRGLAEARAGVDLPLSDEQSWLDWIRNFAAMPAEEMDDWRSGARRYAAAALSTDLDSAKLSETFRRAIAAGPRQSPPVG